ncbi:MAG: SH3 domain-containing protein, partial [Treponema sp.]|nr:SH3 domain-containing protein [Treponema sp.]
MKKSFVIIFCFLFVFSFSFAQEKINVIGHYYTAENLNLRTAPSFHAKKIVTVPKHTAVYVIAEGPSETIDGKTAKWKKVVCDQFENNKQYKAGITGWVFSAYLAEEDKYTDEEIEKILFETFEFSIGSEDIYGFGFSNYEDKKTIRAFRDSNMPGCYESTGSTFHVKDVK